MNLSYNKLGSVLGELLNPHLNMFGSNLEELYLVKCCLTDNEANKLLQAIPRLENILDIDLSHNEFKNTFSKLMQSLGENCYNIHTLSLSSCTFKEGKQNIKFTLQKSPGLQPFMFLKRLDLNSSLTAE